MRAPQEGNGTIIVCPGCARRYRINSHRVSGGRKLRCTGCRKVFEAGPAAAAPGSTPAPAPTSAASGSTANADSALVFVGDENRPFRAAVEEILRGLGCRVETAEEGQAAFRFAVTRKPVLIEVR